MQQVSAEKSGTLRMEPETAGRLFLVRGNRHIQQTQSKGRVEKHKNPVSSGGLLGFESLEEFSFPNLGLVTLKTDA